MSAKSKHKPGFGWDRQLFPQDFKITPDLPLEDCVQRLRSIEQHYIGIWNPFSPDVWLQAGGGNAYDFEIYYNPYRYGRGRATVKCKGAIFVDSWSNQTMVKGRLTLNPNLLIPWMMMAVGFILTLASPNLIWWNVLVGIVGVGLWLKAWMDRRKLRALIYAALQPS